MLLCTKMNKTLTKNTKNENKNKKKISNKKYYDKNKKKILEKRNSELGKICEYCGNKKTFYKRYDIHKKSKMHTQNKLIYKLEQKCKAT